MAVATVDALTTSYCFCRWRRSLTVNGKTVIIPEKQIARVTVKLNGQKAA
jgi:hypothetical protein